MQLNIRREILFEDRVIIDSEIQHEKLILKKTGLIKKICRQR
ncbi:MAG: hypothetical protein SCH39_04250 [Methanosarcinales archaeon]|nr:hypothetical protein [ANME-2 cluster archaeon]MDW7775536.1 hypothetical protein [Methanosarcinales archaeon]